jgi:hypothetical protein
MSTIIAKNNTGSDIFLEDLGVTIPASSNRTLTDTIEVERITESDDLKTKVTSGDITINDGINDLSISDGLLHIKFETEYEDESTKSGTWTVDSTSPIAIEGEGFYKTIDGVLYSYDQSREKWLSKDRRFLSFYRDGETSLQYLKIGELLGGSTIGYLMPRKGTIIGATSYSSAGDDPKNLSIRVDDVTQQTIQQNSLQYKTSELNIDFVDGDFISCYVDDTPRIDVEPWYDHDWEYRKKITIDGTKVEATLDIGFGNTASGSNATGNITFAHNIPTGNNYRILIVGVAIEDTSGTPRATVSGITYNGVAMTYLNAITTSDSNGRTEIWYMLNSSLPASGSYNIIVSFANGPHNGAVAMSASLTNVKQEAPGSVTNSNTGSGTISTNITTTEDYSWLIDAVQNGTNTAFTPGTGQTERLDLGVGSMRGAMSTKPTTLKGLQTMSWTNSSTLRNSHVVASLKPQPSSFTDFPVYVEVPGLNGKALNNGYDIIFVDSDDATLLKHEIEDYNFSTGVVKAWVKIPTISKGTNKEIYCYYGNSSIVTPQEDPANVWDSNYLSIWHLGSDLEDSTSNNNDGTSQGGGVSQITGKLNGGREFDGINDYMSTTNQINGSTLLNCTVECWFRTAVAGGFPIVSWESSQTGTGSADWDLQLYVGTDADAYFGCWTGSVVQAADAIGSYNDNNWHHAVGVLDDSENLVRIYVDGYERATTTYTSVVTGNRYFRLGSYKCTGWPNGADGYFDGDIDETRVSNIVRSPQWITTEYNNQNNPSTFYTIASEEQGTEAAAITNPVTVFEIAWRTE